MIHTTMQPQLKNIYTGYKIMCGCECCISTKSIHSSYLSWCDHYLMKLKDLSQNSQKQRSGEIVNSLFETYKKSVMPHGRHIYSTASGYNIWCYLEASRRQVNPPGNKKKLIVISGNLPSQQQQDWPQIELF